MTFATLQPLADRAALYAAIRQDQLRSLLAPLGDYRWEVDMVARRVRFLAQTAPQHEASFPAQLLATIAPRPESPVWGWAHPQGDPAGASAPLLHYGREYRVPELTAGEISLPARSGDETDLDAVAAQAALVAVELTGRAPTFTAEIEGGTRAIFLLEADLPALHLAEVIEILPELLTRTELADPRMSVWGLARLSGWPLTWLDSAFQQAEITDGERTARVRFENTGALAGFALI